LNLEIALSGVSAKVKPPTRLFGAAEECVGTPDHVIQRFLRDSRYRVKPFFLVYDMIGHATEAEAKKLANFAKRLRRAVIAWLKEKYSKLAEQMKGRNKIPKATSTLEC